MIERFLGAGMVLAIVAAPAPGWTHQTQGQDPVDAAVRCGANVTAVDVTGKDKPLITDPVPVYGIIYVDVRDVAGFAPAPAGHDGEYIWSIWVYLEGNRHAGMQTKSGTASDVDAEDVENCTTSGHSTLRPDILIY